MQQTVERTRRPYEVVVYGATGFTGRLVAEYLNERYHDLAWAIAGRDRGRLEALRRDLDAPDLPILTADSGDRAALESLVRQARVVCTTVGPYARYGSELVAACAANGTDYCDLAGEVPWMRRMIESHEATAQASGARLVHCCGFDSIPSDLGVWFVQHEAQRRFGTACSRVRMRVAKLKGAFSGGTYASLLGVVAAARADPAVARLLNNPDALVPGAAPGPRPPRERQRVVYDSDFASWRAPFVMAGINTRVVRRTHALLGRPWGDDFRYDEGLLTGDGSGGRWRAVKVAAGLGALMAAAATRPGRALLQHALLPKPGEGPDRAAREKGGFVLLFLGETAGGQSLRAEVRGQRDPGYGATSRMLGESAVCLARDEAIAGVPGGFWTPASALGEALIARLQNDAGLTFRIV